MKSALDLPGFSIKKPLSPVKTITPPEEVTEHEMAYIGKLLAVLAQATHIRIDRCWLCRDTDWIGNSQRKGVCHILANDGTIWKWVNK